MAGFWGIKPLFAQLNLSAWSFWIGMFVMGVTVFALFRIIYLICVKKFKRQPISVIEFNENNFRNSTQAMYTSVIAPHYFYGENLNESVNALNYDSSKDFKYFHKNIIRDEAFDGCDNVSECCDAKTTPIRPLTPAYTPHEVVPKEDPLGFLSVPPGYVNNFNNNNCFRVERITHSA